MISQADKDILRELARRVREIAADPRQEERKRLWYRINKLERCRIPVLLRPNNLYTKEIVPDGALETTDPKARGYERDLRLCIWQWEAIDDDKVCEPVVEYTTVVRWPEWIPAKKSRPRTDGLGAYHVVPVIEKESDIDKIIVDNECAVDWDATAKNKAWVEEVFEGILEPRRGPVGTGMSPFDYVCEARGMDNVFTDMYERPDWFEEVMRRLYDSRIRAMKALQDQKALVLNNTYQDCFNGGLAYSDELPADGFDPDHVRLKDLWGATAAQAAVSVSPKMHERFITPFDREYHALFGLTAVACCEPVDRKMHLHRSLPGLRRVSICIWNDFARAAEELGTDYIYSYKPAAALLSRPEWDADADLAQLQEVLEKAKGCHVEIINHETVTVLGKVKRLAEWCKRAKRLAIEHSP